MKDPEEILKENPGSVVFARYAEELAKEGMIEEAIEVLNKGIEANPSYASGYYVLSDIYARKSMHKESANLLERALSLDPQAPRAHFKLGQYLLEVDPDRAREHLRIAQRFEGDAPEVHDLMADVFPGAAVEPEHEAEPDEAVSKASEEQIPAEPEEKPEAEPAFDDTMFAVPEGPEAEVDLDVLETDQALEEEGAEATGEEAALEELLEGEAPESTPEPVLDVPDEDFDFSDLHLDEEEAVEPETLEAEALETEEEAAVTVPETEEPEPETEGAALTAESLGDVTDEDLDFPELLGEEETAEEAEAAAAEATEAAPSAVEEIEETASGYTELIEDFEKESLGEEPEEPADETAGAALAEEAVTPPEEAPPPKEPEDIGGEEFSGYGDFIEDLDDSGGAESPGTVQPEEPMEEESSPGENKSVIEELGGEEALGYSDIMQNGDSIGLDVSVAEQEDVGILEIDEEETLDVNSGSYNLAEIEDQEPVLTEEERADLLALEQSAETAESTDEEEEAGVGGENEGGDLHKSLTKNEIDVLSTADLKPDSDEMNLEVEAREGIDYSDILYGHEPIADETPPSGDAETGTILPETEHEEAQESPFEELDVEAIDTGVTETIEAAAEGEEEPEPREEQADATIGAQMVEEMIDLSPDIDLMFDDAEIAAVEKTSLNELMTDYVAVLREESATPMPTAVAAEEVPREETLSEEPGIPLDLREEEAAREVSYEETTETREATPTIAEIFVSQGLITQAIGVYTTLLSRDPGNEKFQSRLEELKKMIES